MIRDYTIWLLVLLVLIEFVALTIQRENAIERERLLWELISHIEIAPPTGNLFDNVSDQH